MLRREYSGVLATVIGFVFVEVIRHYFSVGEWYISSLVLYILLFVSLIALLLRTLKHYTSYYQKKDALNFLKKQYCSKRKVFIFADLNGEVAQLVRALDS